MPKHAKLSASGAELWMNCPGSVHMAELFPESSSLAAEEGTLAHALAETLIDARLSEELGAPYAFGKDFEAHEARVTDFYQKHPEMEGTYAGMKKTLEPYVDFIFEEFGELRRRDPAAELMTEQHVDFRDVVPGGFGTSDVVLIGDNVCEVIDLKYGKGVPISAIGNPQIKLYAYGTMTAFSLAYDFDTVKTVIYQPRLDSVTSQDMTAADLQKWADYVVAPAAKKALSKKPEYHPGAWCKSHFCPGAGTCKARAKVMQEFEAIIDKRLEDDAVLSSEEMGAALTKARQYAAWAKDLEKEVFDAAQSGEAIPGWKIVESKANRKYKDEDAVARAVIRAGYDKALIYEHKLLNLTKMSALMGKKDFKAVLEDTGLVYKPEGAPTLAPESDKRPAINNSLTATDFDD